MLDTVTIPREEYERLREAAEDFEDLCAYEQAMQNYVEGIPHEYVVRILGGDAPLRVFRDWRGFNQSELARKSGVHRVQIADIEAGRSTGSVATLKKLAEALDIRIDDLA